MPTRLYAVAFRANDRQVLQTGRLQLGQPQYIEGPHLNIVSGEFDVIDSIVEIAERRDYFDFTPAYSTIEASIFATTFPASQTSRRCKDCRSRSRRGSDIHKLN